MPKRILSIDIFRGFTIFMMVFVNDVAGVGNIPNWMKHAGTYDDTMTFVDVVFPAFLFIVGMAIPLAIQNRLAKGQTWPEVWQHVIVRTVGLLILGVYMVNAGEMNKEANLIPAGLWKVLLYVGAIMIWNAYPREADPGRKRLFRGLQVLGWLILAFLAFTFRKGEAPDIGGMTPSWWGILGLIGWAYLYTVVIYYFLRRNLLAMVGVLALLIVVVTGLKFPEMELPIALDWLKGQSGNFSHTMITLSGTLLSILLLEVNREKKPAVQIRSILVYGLFILVAAYFLRPISGISKNLATTSWSLYSSAICCFVFAFLYWLTDVKGYRSWANVLKPAGQNPLLTYVLPFIFYALGGFSFLPEVLNQGGPGILRSVVFSFLILGVADLLTRMGVKMKL